MLAMDRHCDREHEHEPVMAKTGQPGGGNSAALGVCTQAVADAILEALRDVIAEEEVGIECLIDTEETRTREVYHVQLVQDEARWQPPASIGHGHRVSDGLVI